MRRFRNSLITVSVVSLLVTILFLTALPASAANVTDVAISSVSGPPGTVVSITGSGFSAATYTVTMGGITVVPTTAVVAGVISATFAVPVLPRTGIPYALIVTAGTDIVNTPYFTITPAIWLSNASGSVSDTIKVNGYGFFANTTIAISFDGVDIVSTASDSSGSFANVDLIIPQAKGGWHTISARDYIGTSPGVVFVISPKISLSTASGQIGSTIICSGSGFAALSNVSFSIDTVTIGGTAITDANGTLSPTTLTIPAMSGGLHTFKAQDASANSAVASLTVTATVVISPSTGTSGTTVTVTGSGFQSNGTVTITYNGASVATVPSIIQSNTNGSVAASFNASPLPSGVYDVVVSDSVRTATAQFSSVAAARINLIEGKVGTSVTATGTGFRPRGEVAVNYDGVKVGTGSSDIYGNFTVTFSVPSSSAGLHQVVVTDKSNSITFSFKIDPGLTINPLTGYVGGDIKINVSGFGSDKPVTVKYDVDLLTSGTTDSNGAFSATVKAPASKGGNHTITATDGTNTLTAVFAMDSTPPDQPELFFPAPLTKADKNATFSWQAVNDPSGVTYSLQIATDNTFAILVLQKQGLTSPQYTLTPQDVLKSVSKKTPYYWRVRAIDGASNESPWSTSSTFYKGFVLTDWALYIIFGIVAILCGLVGFLLGMKFRPKPPAPKEEPTPQ